MNANIYIISDIRKIMKDHLESLKEEDIRFLDNEM